MDLLISVLIVTLAAKGCVVFQAMFRHLISTKKNDQSISSPSTEGPPQVGDSVELGDKGIWMEPLSGIEPETSSLPRKCSTN
jgi:hypothetical protein